MLNNYLNLCLLSKTNMKKQKKYADFTKLTRFSNKKKIRQK